MPLWFHLKARDYVHWKLCDDCDPHCLGNTIRSPRGNKPREKISACSLKNRPWGAIKIWSKGGSSGERPEFIPAVVGAEDSELCHRFCVSEELAGSGDFQSRLQDVFVAGFDEPAADGQVLVYCAFVVEVFGSVAQVAVGCSHGRVFLAHFGGFAVRFSGADDFLTRSVFELCLLGSPPLLGGCGVAGRGGLAEVVAYVEVVDEQLRIAPENLARLVGQPLRSVAQRVDASVHAAPGFFGDVAPAVADFLHAAKCGRVFGFRAAQCLGVDEPDFSLLARAFRVAQKSCHHRLEHGTIGLGDEQFHSFCRHFPERFCVLFSEDFLRPRCGFECRASHRTRV